MEEGFEYGVEWFEFDRHDRAVKKQKIFQKKETRDKFADTVQDKPNFWKFAAWCN